MDNDQLREFGASLKRFIDCLGGRINDSDMDFIKSDHRAGEYQLAVELILACIVKENIKLSATERQQLNDFAQQVDAGEEFLAPFIAMRPVL